MRDDVLHCETEGCVLLRGHHRTRAGVDASLCVSDTGKLLGKPFAHRNDVSANVTPTLFPCKVYAEATHTVPCTCGGAAHSESVLVASATMVAKSLDMWPAELTDEEYAALHALRNACNALIDRGR